jgi:YD repeat-containing protein
VPNYDAFTGRLLQLNADQNGDGRIDQWTYLDGNRPLRGEADVDGDDRIDRWEYFDARAMLTLIGSSSLGDGVEDTWTRPAATPQGEMQVTRSRMRDRRPDRQEYFRGDVLVRAEEDTNGDGRIDKWEQYEGTSLREAAFDTTFSRGRADRRVRYDARGDSVVETDPDGDGQFVRVPGERVPPARPPGAFE